MRRQAARYGHYPIFRRSSPPLNAADRAVSRYERVQQLYARLTALVAADRATPLTAASDHRAT
jgi:hypothetical protein